MALAKYFEDNNEMYEERIRDRKMRVPVIIVDELQSENTAHDQDDYRRIFTVTSLPTKSTCTT